MRWESGGDSWVRTCFTWFDMSVLRVMPCNTLTCAEQQKLGVGVLARRRLGKLQGGGRGILTPQPHHRTSMKHVQGEDGWWGGQWEKAMALQHVHASLHRTELLLRLVAARRATRLLHGQSLFRELLHVFLQEKKKPTAEELGRCFLMLAWIYCFGMLAG